MSRYLTSFAFLVILLMNGPLSADAFGGEILDAVKARGKVRCGVSEGIPGFSEKDASGRWIGLEADFCRAVAAAVLGDPEKVEFVPLKASERFPALQVRKIDVLVRLTTWTLTREAVMKMKFPAVLFYDGQAFMVPRASKVKTLADLNGATISVEKGTTEEENLVDKLQARRVTVKPLVIDSAAGAADALFDGRCQACTSLASQLAAARLRAPGGPDAYVILPERVSEEPTGPVVLRADEDWETIVRWVLLTLIGAEDLGITHDTAEAAARGGQGEAWHRITGKDEVFAKSLGVEGDWAVRAVKAVGNYGEMFERNVGSGSPLKLERRLNRLWKDGGLMYAPPIK